MANHEVIIIGAGIAGLSCANYLLHFGVTPLVLEAAEAVGGRVRTDKVDGYLLDRGFQILLTAYPEAQRLLNYNTLALKSFRSGALIRKDNAFSVISDPFKEPAQVFKTLFSSVGTLVDKLKVLQLSNNVSKEPTEAFFHERATDTLTYLRNYGWSDEMIADFFKPFFGGVFLENELETSSNFFRFIFKQFYTGDAVIPAGGMQAIPEQMAAKLPPHTLRLNTKVEKIEGNKVHLSDGKTLTAKNIVVATDARQADGLLGRNLKREYNVTTCTYFATERSPLKEKMLALNPNRLSVVHNLCVPSDIAPSYAPEGKALVSVSTQGLELFDEKKLTDRIVQELTSWFGDEVKTWKHLRTYHIPESLVKYPANVPATNLKISEHLYECGDHTSYPSLNAAMATGRAVADMIAGI
ncbi:NAD(P)-binding protein [Runella sp. CRIBMP]|uniref:NAD(P)/FAD-dependent oxidoreductase n=1 Tax=Runella sp. CRIBMP TaxID=2683261 RepID=UPI0014135CEA|nr:NAD(P)/FAD-dependent oxidoreductase [Runella sp. CRIBMP]NBB21006.1 NAD(P)-binding protein [Runella sp. CRIBMP]